MAKRKLVALPQPPLLREKVERRILLVRGNKVMLDSHLAELYGVPTKRLNQQVRRNTKRFPADFMLKLTEAEAAALRSQIATSNDGRGGRRYLPLAFTEQGVAMLSSVLTSDRAVEVNIAIMRTFVQLREMLATNKALAHRMEEMEKRYDHQFQLVFQTLRQLRSPRQVRRKRIIGFAAAG